MVAERKTLTLKGATGSFNHARGSTFQVERKRRTFNANPVVKTSKPVEKDNSDKDNLSPAERRMQDARSMMQRVKDNKALSIGGNDDGLSRLKEAQRQFSKESEEENKVVKVVETKDEKNTPKITPKIAPKVFTNTATVDRPRYKRRAKIARNSNKTSASDLLNPNRKILAKDLLNRINPQVMDEPTIRGTHNRGPKVRRAKVFKDVEILENITVNELATGLAEKSKDIIRLLKKNSIIVGENDSIDFDTASVVATELGHTIKLKQSHPFPEMLKPVNNITKRQPIITIMGHVDHGKTSLLDTLRKSNVVEGEAGGITQHIASYEVKYKEEFITFVDTPGHETFSAMRSRGASVADIVLLVIAGNDSIKPQTVEAIRMIKEANATMIVVVNKNDVAGFNANKVYTDLLTHDIQVESMGGNVLAVEISATENNNIDKLLDTIMIQAEMLDLKADPDALATGVVVESYIQKGHGIALSIITTNGTLKRNQPIVIGSKASSVRFIFDNNKAVNDILPGKPVVITGPDIMPDAGNRLFAVPSATIAKEVAEWNKQQENVASTLATMSFSDISSTKVNSNIIIKADVDGSLEAVKDIINALKYNKAKVNIIQTSVGVITESDVDNAFVTGSIIVAFNIKTSTAIAKYAENKNVKILQHNIIYNIVEDIKLDIESKLEQEEIITTIGTAEIIAVFDYGKINKIAGARVKTGMMKKDMLFKISRGEKVLFDGNISAMKKEKDEVKEAKVGVDVGLFIESFNNYRIGDKIVCYKKEMISAKLD
ncbi:MAG: translation initiation factor IF-2 [Alphaproteobacteria bacterium]|nr:translation initiation factor IF-2 [Alphaproteobacteria bacterium]MBL0717863.1 translation initiation factor IF-2 [Alphaproteobacteria bacterium]